MGGFELIHRRFDDLAIYDNNKESRDKAVDIIKQVDPNFIITHSPDDYMPDHIDFPDMVRTCCRYRGFPCGADYAEGFCQCQVYLKGTTKRLLP